MKKITKDDFFYVVEDNYDEHISRAIPFYNEMHSEIYSFLDRHLQNPLILDLGCGTGFTISVLLKYYPDADITAVDLFDEMLIHAQKRLAKYAKQIDYIKGDFRSLDYNNKRFDICTSVLALHHILPSEKKLLFKNIHHCLAPNGKFILIDWTRCNSQYIQNIAFEIAVSHVKAAIDNTETVNSWANHWKNINIPDTIEEMIMWLRSAGFKHANCTFKYYGLAMIVAEK